MKAVLRPLLAGAISIAIAATSVVGSSSLALAAPPRLIVTWQLESPIYEGGRPILTGTFGGGGVGVGPYTVDVDWLGDEVLESFSLGTTLTPGVFQVQKTQPYLNERPPFTIVASLNDFSVTNSQNIQNVTVLNARPRFESFALSATDIEAGQTVTATGHFADGGTNDIHTVRVAWDDGSPVTEFVLPVGTRTFTTVAHKYRLVGNYTVSADVTDDALAWDGAIATLNVHALQVPNQAPTMTSEFTAGPEGGNSTLAVTFADADAADTHTVFVDWGDGQTTNSGTLAATQTRFDAPHVYADTLTYSLVLTLTDSATPAHSVTETKSVSPTNVAPEMGTLSLSPSPVVDHQELTLTGGFTDPTGPGTTETFTYKVAWGDGTSSPEVSLGTDKFFSAKHVYDSAGPVTITATVTDANGGDDSSTANLVVGSSNHAPTDLAFAATATGANVVVTGSFTDPDATDTHTVALSWGDGVEIEVDADGTTFTAPHVYAVSKTYTVTATVTDHPANASTGPVSNPVVVTIPPTDLAFDVTATGANVVVTGSFTDPDTTDTHTVALSWGDGVIQEVAAEGTTFTAPHVYAVSNTYTVTVTVTDHPAGTSTLPLSKTVVVTIPASSAADVLDEMSARVRTFNLDRNTERWLLKKIDDLKASLAYGNGQVCSVSGTLDHILAFADRTIGNDQFAEFRALTAKLEAAAGCTSNGAQSPKVQKAAAVTAKPATPTTTATSASTPKKDTTAKSTKADTKVTAGRSTH